MKIAIVAVGRLGRGPEAELVKTYAERATAAGRALGLGPVEVIEVEARKPGKAAFSIKTWLPWLQNTYKESRIYF